MEEKTDLSRCAQIAQDKDKDRFIVALTARPEYRESLFALIAFNHEIAKTRESVSESMLGQIRLQWWREAVAECYEGTPRHHEVVEPLAEAINKWNISRSLLEQMIDSRETDLAENAPENLDDLIIYARNTGGLLNEACAEVLGARDETSRRLARQVGTAWALTGLMRSLPFGMRQKHIMVPQDLLRKYEVNRHDLLELRNPANLRPAVREICEIAADLIRRTRQERAHMDMKALPVMHLAGFAESYLKQLEKAGYDTFSPTLARPRALRNLALILRHILKRF